MNETTKNLLMLLLGLILGFLIGHFALPPECAPEKGERGPLGVPPSQLPEVMERPEGTWPKHECEGAQAIQMLDEIFDLVDQAGTMLPPRIEPLTQFNVVQAIYNKARQTEVGDPVAACQKVAEALQKAKDIVAPTPPPGAYGDLWAAVIDDLEMPN